MPVVLRIDASDLGDMAKAFRYVSLEARDKILYRALNRTGDQAFTAVKRVLSKETGLKIGRVARALNKRKAFTGRLAYEIVARGGFLKITAGNFGARQVRRGVSHRAWGRRQTAQGAFIPSGYSVAFKRLGRERLPIRALYGPAIPREMVRGESDQAIRGKVRTVFIPRVLHETERAIASAKGRYGL